MIVIRDSPQARDVPADLPGKFQMVFVTKRVLVQTLPLPQQGGSK